MTQDLQVEEALPTRTQVFPGTSMQVSTISQAHRAAASSPPDHRAALRLPFPTAPVILGRHRRPRSSTRIAPSRKPREAENSDVRLHAGVDMDHGYHFSPVLLPEKDLAFQEIARFLQRVLRSPKSMPAA